MSLLYLQIHEEWMETCYGSAYLEQVIIKYKEAKTLNECEDKIKNWSWNSWAYTICGSYRPGLFCKKSVLRNFAKYTGKHLCQSLFFTLLKRRLWYRRFPVNFSKFPRKPLLTEHLRVTTSQSVWLWERLYCRLLFRYFLLSVYLLVST